MWPKILEFFRTHVLMTALAAASAGLSIGGGVVATVYESRVNRLEDMKVAEFNEVIIENKKFLENLNAFTQDVDKKGKIDQAKRNELSATLTRLYTNLGTFSVNVSGDEIASVRELQTSVNEVKKQLQLMTEKQDLDPLGVALVDYFIKMKAAKPVIEAAVGKTGQNHSSDDS
ncbi:UNVERIFIED_ORG: ribosomal protein L29 [Rhizobium etli]